MPELPEVETVCRGLRGPLTGQTLSRIELRRAGLRFPFPPGLKKIRAQKITGLERRAKYIVIHLAAQQSLLIHLGMSGRLILNGSGHDRHDHVVLHLANTSTVVFNDARRFGVLDLVPQKSLAQHKLLKALGPEPLAASFNAPILAKSLRGKKAAIKQVIMDQRVVVGVGNIYASEALFMAKIDPRRPAKSLALPEVRRLVTAIKKVLRRAIAAGGSSLKDYVQSDGELGYFQHQFSVYDREGLGCRRCRAPIARMIQGGRATYYCAQCQR